MSFDARSRERLEALGRQLPRPLPLPEPARPRPDAPRHAVEIEQDPEQLFRELMAASADGSVPPHLMDRLRELEQARRLQSRDRVQAGGNRSGGAATGPAATPGGEAKRPNRGGRSGSSPAANGRPGSQRPRNAEEEALYTAFQQLLLEGDDEAL